nr:MAG TPA: hypothetical protein [Caudoviricetes sp.]
MNSYFNSVLINGVFYFHRQRLNKKTPFLMGM